MRKRLHTYVLYISYSLFIFGFLGALQILGQDPDAQSEPPPTLYVLAIGISNYQYPNSRNSPWKRHPAYARKDARDFSAAIEQASGKAFAKTIIRFLPDRMATRDGISRAMQDIIRHAQPQDTFIFFFSGHGLARKIAQDTIQRFYLIPSDFNPAKGNSEIKRKGISSILLQSWFLGVLARHQLIILDSSKSSTGFGEFTSALNRDYEELKSFVDRDTAFISIRGTSFEFRQLGNGLLTNVILDGLRGGAAALTSGEISAKGLAEYTEKHLPVVLRRILSEPTKGAAIVREEIRRDSSSGTPFTFASGEDFVLGNRPQSNVLSPGPGFGNIAPVMQPGFGSDTSNITSDLVNFESSYQASSTIGESVAERSPPSDTNSSRQQEPVFIPQARCVALSEVYEADPSSPRYGKDYALLIAVDNYDKWDDLSNPVFDAEALAQKLNRSFGFRSELVRNPDVDCISDVLKKYRLGGRIPKDGQLMIFFAGHGFYEDEEGFLVAKDSKAQAEDSNQGSYFRQSKLRIMANNMPSKHVFVVIDSCFSGAFAGEVRTGPDGGTDDDPAETESDIDIIMKYPTRRFLTSGGLQYVSDGVARRHSPFANKLLTALAARPPGRNFLIIGDLMVTMKLMKPLRPVPIWGELSANDRRSDFVFLYK